MDDHDFIDYPMIDYHQLIVACKGKHMKGNVIQNYYFFAEFEISLYLRKPLSRVMTCYVTENAHDFVLSQPMHFCMATFCRST